MNENEMNRTADLPGADADAAAQHTQALENQLEADHIPDTETIGRLRGAIVNLETVIFNGLNIRGIYGRKVWDTWYKMTTMLEAGLDISAIITHRMNIKDYKKGFDAMISGNSGKVILDWAHVND